MTQIIDISTWNGAVDFEKVKAAGIEGVILRAGFGNGTVDNEFIGNLGEIIADGRRQLEAGLRDLGIRVIPSEANYMLIYTKKKDFKPLLEQKGILIRSCRDFRGLGEGWYRIAVRKAEDNQKLLDACKEVV